MRSKFELTGLAISTNGLFSTLRRSMRRVKSSKYDMWRVMAMQEIMPQVKQKHLGTVDVVYLCERDTGAKDIGNVEKALSDLLVSAGVIVDDNRIESILQCWAPVKGIVIEVIDTVHRLDVFNAPSAGQPAIYSGERPYNPPSVYLPFGVSDAGKRFNRMSYKLGGNA